MSIEALTSDYVGGAALVPEDFVSQGVPVLHKGAIKPGGRIEVDSKKKGFVTPQTALHHTRNLAGPDRIAVTLRDLVPSGPCIGLMADLSTTAIPEYILAQGAYAFRVDESKVLPDYLIALVNMPAFRLVLRQNAVGSTQIHIRLPVFKSIEIPVPPIGIQHKFARIISHISSIDALGRDRIQRINELTRALQSSSFSGQPI
jgi:type I restriction enzyme S subunit